MKNDPVDVRDKDNKWVKDQWMKMPHKGKFRQSIIKLGILVELTEWTFS